MLEKSRPESAVEELNSSARLVNQLENPKDPLGSTLAGAAASQMLSDNVNGRLIGVAVNELLLA
jgi:hypothetical protein